MEEQLTIDRISIEILAILANDARITLKELAAAVNLAPSSCHERVKQLRAMGVLLGERSEINLGAIGYRLEAVLHIELAKHDRGAVDTFVQGLTMVPEVRQVFLVTGRFDLVAHVIIRDMEHLKNLAFDHFTSNQAVVRIETSVVFQSWSQRRLPGLIANRP